MKEVKTVLKTNNAVQNWYDNGGKDKIKKNVMDPDGIFDSDAGNKPGVYGVYVVTPDQKEILMYIGEVGKENRGFKDRLVEHLRYWIENPEHYAGVKKSELKSGYHYLIRILEIEKDDDKRYAKEQELCEIMKPYTQSGVYPKYKCDYKGFDLAIFPTYRRRAFLVARDGKYTEESNTLFVDNIFKLNGEEDFSKFKNVIPNQDVVNLIEKEMPNGSDVWRSVKTFVENAMGITSSRGCRYSYLVKIVAAALETTYIAQCSL